MDYRSPRQNTPYHVRTLHHSWLSIAGQVTSQFFPASSTMVYLSLMGEVSSNTVLESFELTEPSLKIRVLVCPSLPLSFSLFIHKVSSPRSLLPCLWPQRLPCFGHHPRRRSSSFLHLLFLQRPSSCFPMPLHLRVLPYPRRLVLCRYPTRADELRRVRLERTRKRLFGDVPRGHGRRGVTLRQGSLCHRSASRVVVDLGWWIWRSCRRFVDDGFHSHIFGYP
jgi:hypothetical protein